MMFKLHDVIDFIIQNQEEHSREAKEIGMLEYDDVSVDFDYYLAMSQLGRCFVFLRDGNYSVLTFNENPLHKNVMEANNEIFFVKDRNKTKEFMKDTISAAKSMGAKKVNFIVKNPKVGRYLGMCGLKKTHELWSA